MILSSTDIEERSTGPRPLIAPFVEKNVRRSSYDLTIGDEFYDGFDGKWTVQTKALLEDQSFTIPPHGVCFILSAETISLPGDLTAKVSLRMSLVYRGLVLTSQPPFDPWYAGKVVVMVHNLTSQSHSLKRGDRIATIEFFEVSNPEPLGNLPPHRSVGTLLGQLTGPVSSSLVDISRKAASAHRKVFWVYGQVLLFATLLIAIIAVPGFYSYSAFSERLGDERSRVDELKKTVEEQRHTLKRVEQELAETRAAGQRLKAEPG